MFMDSFILKIQSGIFFLACANKWFHSTSKNETNPKYSANRNKQSETSTWFELFGPENHEILSHQFPIFHRRIYEFRMMSDSRSVFSLFRHAAIHSNFSILTSSKEMSHHETGITWEIEKRCTVRVSKGHTQQQPKKSTYYRMCDTEQEKVAFSYVKLRT